MPTDPETILAKTRALASQFAGERRTRQARRQLVRADFDALAEAGYLRLGVPKDYGGAWESVRESVRPVTSVLRALASGDSSVALVSAMHPIVLAFWHIVPDAPPDYQDAWQAQRRWVFESALGGAWWGTIASEPGTGGDIAKTQTIARSGDRPGEYLLTGSKHFASGSGLTNFMNTTALPEGETEPDWFFYDARALPWDGSRGLRLVEPWDGHGMIATQSHAFAFEDLPASRFAWPGQLKVISAAGGGFNATCFTAVVVGIVETALVEARRVLGRKAARLRSYEQVEWTRAELEGWLIQQAFEGMVRAVEADGGTPRAVLLGKAAIAELAESALARVCRVIGGGTYSRQSPFGNWLQDVRALGLLRPPLSLAYDRLLASAWPPE